MKKIYLLILMGLFAVTDSVYAQQRNPNPGLFVDFTARGGSNEFSSVGLFIIEMMLGLIGTIALVYLIYGGFLYLTAGFNSTQSAQGRKIVTNAIIGLIIAILSYIIVTVVVNSLYS